MYENQLCPFWMMCQGCCRLCDLCPLSPLLPRLQARQVLYPMWHNQPLSWCAVSKSQGRKLSCNDREVSMGKRSGWHQGTARAAFLSGLITNIFLGTFFSLQRFIQNSVFRGKKKKKGALCNLCVQQMEIHNMKCISSVYVFSRWQRKRRRKCKTWGSQLYQGNIPVYA